MYENELRFEKCKKMAYSIAHQFCITKYSAFMDREDLEQSALLYLWKATESFDESNNKAKFSTYAYRFIYNGLVNELIMVSNNNPELSHERFDIESEKSLDLNESGIYGISDPSAESELSYNLTKIDLEMQLKQLRTKNIKTKKSTTKKRLDSGITILEKILSGMTPGEIMNDLRMPVYTYRRCVTKAREELKANFK